MAHKKGAGSTDNGRDSRSNRLGVKKFAGEHVLAGNILIRQRGTKFHVGRNVYISKDHTIHAKIEGTVSFSTGSRKRKFIHVNPLAEGVPSRLVKYEKVKLKSQLTFFSDAPKTVKKVKPKAVKKAAAKPAAAPKKETPKAVEKPKAAPQVKTKTEKIVLPSGKKVKQDDLTFVEGIGPKISELLQNAGVTTWAELSNTSVDKIKEVLAAAGSRYTMHNPTTWPKQAGMAANGEWVELEKYQDYLDGGVEPKSKSEEE